MLKTFAKRPVIKAGKELQCLRLVLPLALAFASGFILSFFFLSGASEKELHGNGLVVCILCIGFFVGPIQPITAEVAVEVCLNCSAVERYQLTIRLIFRP